MKIREMKKKKYFAELNCTKDKTNRDGENKTQRL